ncbi:histidine kinase [Pedobacter panaciterrae]|uniref:Histidine kinase n=1 Tax=Pedobacter panaciterrae TaxID=363849 RepID=A0ABU8NKG3_9SPHI
MLYLISYLIDPFADYWKMFFHRPWFVIILDLVFSVFFCALISESSIFINARFNDVISWMDRPMIRLVLQTLSTLLCTLVIISVEFLVGHFFEAIHWDLGQKEITGISQWIIVSTIIALMISGVNTANFLISNWKNTFTEAAEFKQAAAEAELHALKLQVDPHFVFNNLSVLSELILKDQELGYEYAENFSKVYRYLLLNARKDVISLQDELKFVDSYIFLIEKRVGASVVFKITIDKHYLLLQLPPMTMQILIENALKHNKTLKNTPLNIEITVDEHNSLVVANNLIPLDRKPLASGIGLMNIINRYRLLCDQEVKIEESESHFRIRIPLLKAANY